MGSMSLKTNVLLLINVIIIIILLIIEGFHITENKCTFADPQPQLLEMINLYLFPPQKRLIGVDFRFLCWLGFGTKFTRLLHGAVPDVLLLRLILMQLRWYCKKKLHDSVRLLVGIQSTNI